MEWPFMRVLKVNLFIYVHSLKFKVLYLAPMVI